jgi:quinol monooxygenase YgiN
MVTEIAYLKIDPARGAEFATAVAEAAALFRSAQGCRSMRIDSVVEDESAYRLVVEWDSVDDHMITFRDSPAFARWRELAGLFFVEPPRVEHWQNVATHF